MDRNSFPSLTPIRTLLRDESEPGWKAFIISFGPASFPNLVELRRSESHFRLFAGVHLTHLLQYIVLAAFDQTGSMQK